MSEAVQIGLMTADGDQILSTTWIAQGGYTDVREQLTALFGAPVSDVVIPFAVLAPHLESVMADPSTKVQIGDQ